MHFCWETGLAGSKFEQAGWAPNSILWWMVCTISYPNHHFCVTSIYYSGKREKKNLQYKTIISYISLDTKGEKNLFVLNEKKREKILFITHHFLSVFKSDSWRYRCGRWNLFLFEVHFYVFLLLINKSKALCLLKHKCQDHNWLLNILRYQ